VPATSIRVVLDTNVLLRGLLNSHSAAGRVIKAIEQRNVVQLLSKPLLDEYRAVLSDRSMVERFPKLTDERVKLSLKRFRYQCEYFHKPRRSFHFERDSRDEKLIELAIEGMATHIISTDRDLLDLPKAYSETSKRFRQRLPNVRVLTPPQFLDAYALELEP
jgi:putative PIN family toxin of toxin-antitoxin system